MAELKGRGLTKEVTVNKFNISGISEATLKQDIQYIMHIEHELPMEWYTRLDAVIDDLVHNAIVHSDAAVRRSLRDVSYTTAKRLQDVVGEVVLDSVGDTSERIVVEESHDLSELMGGE